MKPMQLIRDSMAAVTSGDYPEDLAERIAVPAVGFVHCALRTLENLELIAWQHDAIMLTEKGRKAQRCLR